MDELATFTSLLYIVPLVVFALVVFELLSPSAIERVLLIATFFTVVLLSYLWIDALHCCLEPSEQKEVGYISDKARLLIDSLIVLALYLYIYKVLKFDTQ
ncbi:hypothetical protein L1D24_14835 [Vibrio brasiliensis]|uniref:hypothetical protein n=1 Tax=Vibrio brasiliensis TaxID=170652 RepID=UPI001EFDB3F5|nr:hypothetical protein [Vibrio brasiliensis]MCG9649836.1 hypothetical protein [Vibrio brasiliensis]